MTARRFFPAIFIFISVAAATCATGIFFARFSKPSDTAGMLAVFFGCFTAMALLPGMLAGKRRLCRRAEWQTTSLTLLAAFAGVWPALFWEKHFSLAVFSRPAGAMLIAVSFAALMVAAGRTVARMLPGGRRDNRRAAALATLFTVVFLLSPLWSGALLNNGDDLGKLAAVWLSPPAMLGAALPELNFSCLPGLYHIWMGSLCPVPNRLWLAAGAYALPAAFLFGFSQWRFLWR